MVILLWSYGLTQHADLDYLLFFISVTMVLIIFGWKFAKMKIIKRSTAPIFSLISNYCLLCFMLELCMCSQRHLFNYLLVHVYVLVATSVVMLTSFLFFFSFFCFSEDRRRANCTPSYGTLPSFFNFNTELESY